MRFIERLVEMKNIEMEEPIIFGGFHIFCCLAVILVSFLFCALLKDSSDRAFRISIGVMFGIMLILEVFKEVIFPMSIVEGAIVYEYDWTMFPMQLCSTPLYVLPFLAFLPDCNLRDLAAAYTMTCAFIGGFFVFAFPKSVFGPYVVENVQTMSHHGIQIVSGVYTAAYYRRRINKRFFLSGIGVFTFFYTIANLLNTVGYELFVKYGIFEEGCKFNMFYVSPREDQAIPVIDDLLSFIPPALLIVLYFVGIVIGSALIMLTVDKLYKLSRKGKGKRGIVREKSF